MAETATFRIKPAFLVPLGLLIGLLFTLLGVIIVKDQPLAKIVILVVMIGPVCILFFESIFRRIHILEDRIRIKKLLRTQEFLYADITAFDLMVIKKRAFATLSTEAHFTIFSNAYARFPRMLALLRDYLPEAVIHPETLPLFENPPDKSSDIVSCWVGVILLCIIIFVQF